MKLILNVIFRRTPADLVVFAGVNNTVESSEDTKVVREVTEVFLHEQYENNTLSNDIAIIKVGLLLKYETLIF
jgi:secreted trypsin-like serine protease